MTWHPCCRICALSQGPHPNHASKYLIKNTLFCVWKYGYINYGIIRYSIILLYWAGLVMCNSSPAWIPSQIVYCSYKKAYIWIQKGFLWLFTYFYISKYNIFVLFWTMICHIWSADINPSKLFKFGTCHSHNQALGYNL